jgi:hypothetical protein
MMNKSKILRFLSLGVAAFAFALIAGHFSTAQAQKRDPFEKPAWAKPKTPGQPNATTPGAKKEKPKPPVPMPVAPPAIQDRINYYKRLREMAVLNNQVIPKVTSVLTLDEMAVTGIFRTPRGYAAMVEAKPIKLSYTIYPGEKFFDGQLVAIEENRLVFRKVTKWSDGKTSRFVASEENKPLRQYTTEQEVNGTAPVEASTTGKTETSPAPGTTQPANTAPVNTAGNSPQMPKMTAPASIVSPLDEMMRQPPAKPDEAKKPADKKGRPTGKKAVKVAENKNQ